MTAQLIQLIVNLISILIIIAIGLSIAAAKWRTCRNWRDAYFALLKWVVVAGATALWKCEMKRDGIGHQASPTLYDEGEGK